MCVYVCVRVCEREREGERMREFQQNITAGVFNSLPNFGSISDIEQKAKRVPFVQGSMKS